jgi:TM2 domain-containing membrane protein YozV
VFRKKPKNTTNKIILGLGTLAAGAGKLIGGKIGYGIAGFGLAHILFGSLGMLRSPLRSR